MMQDKINNITLRRDVRGKTQDGKQPRTALATSPLDMELQLQDM